MTTCTYYSEDSSNDGDASEYFEDQCDEGARHDLDEERAHFDVSGTRSFMILGMETDRGHFPPLHKRHKTRPTSITRPLAPEKCCRKLISSGMLNFCISFPP